MPENYEDSVSSADEALYVLCANPAPFIAAQLKEVLSPPLSQEYLSAMKALYKVNSAEEILQSVEQNEGLSLLIKEQE